MQASLATVPALNRHALGPWQAPTPTAPVFAWHIKASVGWPSRKWHASLLMLPALLKQAKSPTHALVCTLPVLPSQALAGKQLPAGGLGGPASATDGRSKTARPRASSRAIRARDGRDMRASSRSAWGPETVAQHASIRARSSARAAP